jgi:hypothetical protein
MIFSAPSFLDLPRSRPVLAVTAPRSQHAYQIHVYRATVRLDAGRYQRGSAPRRWSLTGIVGLGGSAIRKVGAVTSSSLVWSCWLLKNKRRLVFCAGRKAGRANEHWQIESQSFGHSKSGRCVGVAEWLSGSLKFRLKQRRRSETVGGFGPPQPNPKWTPLGSLLDSAAGL